MPPPAHSAPGSAEWSWQWPRALLTWATIGEGATRQARLSRGGHEKVFRKPRRQWERTKEFQGNSIYSRVRSKLQARLKMCRYSDIPKSCPHIACMVPPTPDTVHSHFSTFQEHLTQLECGRQLYFLITQKHLSIVFLASLLMSARLFFYFSQILF